MNVIAAGMGTRAHARFYDSTIGKKAVMAVSGIILFAFLIAHLLGNLQVFAGAEKMNQYAHVLRAMPAALWAARAVLLVAVLAHIWSAVELGRRKLDARPVSYVKKRNVHSSYAARTMYWSGPIVLAFIVYHLLHFTLGIVTPGQKFSAGDVYGNLVGGFRIPVVSAAYIVAMGLLCLHLYHGLWSMLQSLGLHHPRYTVALRRAAAVFSVALCLGFVSIPVAVLAGGIR